MKSRFLDEALRWSKTVAIEELAGEESRWSKTKSTTANLLECQRLMNEVAEVKQYFTLLKNDQVIDEIETKCTRPEQIEEINNFLKKNGILNDEVKVMLVTK